jgi:pilus assembly protein Flp/PilA
VRAVLYGAYHWTISWLKTQEGATAVEYAIMASLIAAVIAGVVTSVGSSVQVLLSAVDIP